MELILSPFHAIQLESKMFLGTQKYLVKMGEKFRYCQKIVFYLEAILLFLLFALEWHKLLHKERTSGHKSKSAS